MAHKEITVTVNGVTSTRTVEPRTLLSDFLRHDLRLTGTHVGCEHGVCGSCTVLLDGAAVRACLVLAAQVDGHTVETVESLADEGRLCGAQRAVMEEHGLQCGFCTPGILMSMAAAERDEQTADEVVSTVLQGHVCRCTGYLGLRAAIERHFREREAAR
ncbi:(2Fe-2S)-binding protein [Lentzea sp. NPDC004782]|uniref:(2Fe-2S)-binding protein n=1 Tax=Lentzea sp. NPDC004782 TaxID=3154458 RepID=UPI0033A39D66